MRYAFTGGENVFHNFAHALGKTGEPEWQNRGGHRLWVAPESPVSKAPDNRPVKIEAEDLRLIVSEPVEPESGVEKRMEISMQPAGTRVTVHHRITNRNRWPIRFAPWALSVMRPGGIAITRFPPRARHDERLLPTNPLVMWGYTDFADPRWRFTPRFLLLKQDSSQPLPQKAGLFTDPAWAAYAVGGDLFVKQARAEPNGEYPDFGCSVEMFTNRFMLEIETLGPLRMVEPGESAEHTEMWSLHRAAGFAEAGDEQLAEALNPLIGTA